MAVKSIQLGQVWRNDTDGQDYLVTKMYSEVFTQYALLASGRIVGAGCADSSREGDQERRRRLASGIHFYSGRRILKPVTAGTPSGPFPAPSLSFLAKMG